MTIMKELVYAKIPTILIITALVFIVGTLSLSTASATNYWSGKKWNSVQVKMCYDAFSLGDLNIGSTNAINELEQSKNAWNNQPSNWVLTRVNPDDFCKNWNSAVTLGQTGTLAQTWVTSSGNIITDTDTEYNDSYTWSTARSCTPGTYTMDYVANHEFGHWVMFNHPAQTETSVMVPNYDCNKYDTIKSHDSGSLTSIYG